MATLQLFFNRPFPLQTSQAIKLRTALVFGAFVFVFLYVFQPFQIGNLGTALLSIALGYGATTFMVMVVLNIGILALLPKYADEQSWNTGKELFWTMLNFLAIALANLAYSYFIGVADLSLKAFVIFGGYTLGVGIFPAILGLLLREKTLRQQFEMESKKLNEELSAANTPHTKKSEITITSENNQENLTLKCDELLFVRAAENYVEVHFMHQQKIVKRLLRNTLSQVTLLLETEDPTLWRCHKSYLVNLYFVTKVSGNAQGYKLHLQHTDELIPVSRQHNQTLHQRLAVAP